MNYARLLHIVNIAYKTFLVILCYLSDIVLVVILC